MYSPSVWIDGLIVGLLGASVSTVNVKYGEAALVFPARSVALTEIVCAPSLREALYDHLPAVSTATVPMGVGFVPSNNEMVLPGSAPDPEKV